MIANERVGPIGNGEARGACARGGHSLCTLALNKRWVENCLLKCARTFLYMYKNDDVWRVEINQGASHDILSQPFGRTKFLL